MRRERLPWRKVEEEEEEEVEENREPSRCSPYLSIRTLIQADGAGELRSGTQRHARTARRLKKYHID